MCCKNHSTTLCIMKNNYSDVVFWPKYCDSFILSRLWQLPSLITTLHNHLSNWAFNRRHQSYCISHLQKSRNPGATQRMSEWLLWAGRGASERSAAPQSGAARSAVISLKRSSGAARLYGPGALKLQKRLFS